MILFRIVKYFSYIIVSNGMSGYGIHSPFVFDLVTRILRNKPDPDIVYRIEKSRKRLLNDRRIIMVNDLGGGSDRLRHKQRKTAEIARYSAVPGKYGRVLANMSAEFGKPLILEFGTSLGISTMYLASFSCGSPVCTMEGCSATADIAAGNFADAAIDNIHLIKGSFEKTLPDLIEKGIKPGLVFIDGDHRKESVIDYFEKIAEISDNSTVIIIDDINYSREMADAWKIIKGNSRVSFTIDLFRMGLVFFREGIVRNNYVIRY